VVIAPALQLDRVDRPGERHREHGRRRFPGLLEPLPDRGKRDMAYTKPAQAGEQQSLLSVLEENNGVGN